MKNLFVVFLLSLVSTAFAAETKQVCHDKLDKAGKPIFDKKTSKSKQECKTIKIHKKLEGTEVPVKK
jgi:hypothetical protein